MNTAGSFESFEPHEIGKLLSILPNSKINLVQLLKFSKLTEKEMKKVDEEPTAMQKILCRLGIPQHLTLASHFEEGVLCCDRYQDAIRLSYRGKDQFLILSRWGK